MGVVVSRYIEIFPSPLVLALIFAAASLLLCSFFFGFVMYTVLVQNRSSFKHMR